MSNNNPKTPSTSASPTLPRGLISRRGGVVNPSARMSSLKPPRDLTLGGKPKKSFKPNIPVRKERSREELKDSSSASTSSSAPNEKDRDRRGFKNGSNNGGPRGRGRGRGRGGRRQPETIQTHSIFEQGPMERSKGRGSSAPSYGGGGGGDASFSSKAGIKKIKNEDMDSDMLADLLRDDFIDDSSLSKADERYNPVHLPLTTSLPKREKKEKKEESMEVQNVDEEKPDLTMDVDVKVKSEPPDKDVDMKEFAKPAPVTDKLKSSAKSKMSSQMEKEVTCSSLFGSNRFDSEGELVFFQLPDTLPSFPSSSEEEERKPVIKQEKDAAGSSQQQKEDQDASSQGTCCLKDLPEGYLGKLQVMKSGKTRLLLGNIKLDVSMGSPCGFLQDLVSVKLEGDKGGELVTLGHINHRVVCTPDFEQLLQLGS